MAVSVRDPQQRTTRNTLRRYWLGWGLVILILTVLALTLDLDEVVAAFARVDPAELVAILLLMTLDRLIMAWKWSMLLRAVGVSLPLATIIRYYYQGTLSGTFLPSQVGGDVLRGYWVSQATGSPHAVFASVVMEKVIGILSAVTFAIVGIVVLACLAYSKGSWSWIALGVSALIAVNGAFFLSMRPAVHDFVLRRLRRWEGVKLFGLLHRLYEAYARFTNAPGALCANLLITHAEQALQIAVTLLVAHSLGITEGISTTAFLAVSAIYLMIYRIPVSPDNWGVGELTAIGVFGLIGIKAEAAFSFTFLAHILQVVVVLPGLLFLLQSPYRSTRRPTVTLAGAGEPAAEVCVEPSTIAGGPRQQI